jgi:poly-gamma-glutamate synthesis protein (capsule biosynthesis protein)
MKPGKRLTGHISHLLNLVAALCLLLGACAPLNPGGAIQTASLSAPLAAEAGKTTITNTPFEPVTNTPVPDATATLVATSTPFLAVWMAEYIPESVSSALVMPEGTSLVSSTDEALVRLEITTAEQAGFFQPTADWVYALVAPFPTVSDGVSSIELSQRWQGKAGGAFGQEPLMMDQSTLQVFTALWGQPAEGAVAIFPAQELLNQAWKDRPSWGIVPFERLEPGWKVLEVDGVSPLWKQFNPETYPLTVHFGLAGDAALVESIVTETRKVVPLPIMNRDPTKLTTVILTGVTAMVRATAETMRRKGNTYPAKDVGPILSEADIVHISNEVPFAKNCPQPDPWQTTLVFCSRPEYIALLEEIGTDVVELTGDHFADWGPEAMRFTLEMYRERNWTYYGGGDNVEDGRQARLFEINGNKIAFLGCNAKGGPYATASKINPGAVKCDWEWMSNEIKRLTQQGYNVITTFQHFEYYTYKAQPNQVKDSQAMAEAGSVIVSGSQAHQPQSFEFYKNALIHYGLGNLFFDQYHMGLPTSQGFLDRHVFYDGRHISTELIGILFVDFARPRLMTPQEREVLLKSVFSASGW